MMDPPTESNKNISSLPNQEKKDDKITSNDDEALSPPLDIVSNQPNQVDHRKEEYLPMEEKSNTNNNNGEKNNEEPTPAPPSDPSKSANNDNDRDRDNDDGGSSEAKLRSIGGSRLTSPITIRNTMMSRSSSQIRQRGGNGGSSSTGERGEGAEGSGATVKTKTIEDQVGDDLEQYQQLPTAPPLEFSTDGIIPESTTNWKVLNVINPLRASRMEEAQRALSGINGIDANNITRSSLVSKPRRDSTRRAERRSTTTGAGTTTSRGGGTGTAQQQPDSTSSTTAQERSSFDGTNLSPRRLSPAVRSTSWSPAVGGSTSPSPGSSVSSAAARRAAAERKSREMFAMPPLSATSEDEATVTMTNGRGGGGRDGSNNDDDDAGADYRNDGDIEGGVASNRLSEELSEEDLFVPGAYSVSGSMGDQVGSSLEWSLMDMDYTHGENTTQPSSSPLSADGGIDGSGVATGGRASAIRGGLLSSSRRPTSALSSGSNGTSNRDVLINAVLVEEDEEDDDSASEKWQQRQARLQAWEDELGRKERELEQRLGQSSASWWNNGNGDVAATRPPSVVAEAIARPTSKSDYLAKVPTGLKVVVENDVGNKLSHKNMRKNRHDGGGDNDKIKATPGPSSKYHKNGMGHGVNGGDDTTMAVTSGTILYQESLFATFQRQSGPFLTFIASRLHTNLDTRDRTYHLKTYRKCFVACEAIDCMIEMKITDSRKEAVLLGRLLQDVIGFWHHVCYDHDFDDEYFFFRLSRDEADLSSLSTTDTPPPQSIKPRKIKEEGGGGKALMNKKIKNPLRKILHNPGSIDELDSQHSRSSSTVTDEDLSSIASRLVAQLDIRDRSYRLKKYKKCFIACEAVDVMVNTGIANSRHEAVLLGRQLQDTIGFWNHVCGDHEFKDQFLFFRLSCDEADLNSNSSTKNKKRPTLNTIIHQSRSSGTTERISDDSIRSGSVRSFSSASERDIVEPAEGHFVVPESTRTNERKTS